MNRGPTPSLRFALASRLAIEKHTPTAERRLREALAYLNWRRIDRAVFIGGWFIAEPWLAAVPATAAAIGALRVIPSFLLAAFVGVAAGMSVSMLRRRALFQLQALAAQTGGEFVPETDRHHIAEILSELSRQLEASGGLPTALELESLDPMRLAGSDGRSGLRRGRPATISSVPKRDHALVALLGIWVIMLTAILSALHI